VQAVQADMIWLCSSIAGARCNRSRKRGAPFDLPVRLQRGYYLFAPRGRAHPALDHFREWLLDIAAKDPDVIACSPHYSQDELNNQ